MLLFFRKKYNRCASSGFTLLEVLLVVAIIAVLAGIVIVAINPTKQLSDARNVERRSNLNEIYKGIQQYYIDHGSYPTSSIPAVLTDICDTRNTPGPSGLNCGSYVDLSNLVPTYLAAIPHDPSFAIDSFIPIAYASLGDSSGYQIALTPVGSRSTLALVAPNTERLTSAIAIGTSTEVTSGGEIGGGGSQAFAYTGSNQSWVVPSGVTSITVKAWGAGGGGGGGIGGESTQSGGGGGFAKGNIAVTPGETLTFIVGEGGDSVNTMTPAPATYGGGGSSGINPGAYAGAGGGRSAVRRGSTELLTAGGGGGAGRFNSNSGGAGGGNVGADGNGSTTHGYGGTQSAGGAGGSGTSSGNSGSQYTGGSGNHDGGYTGGGGGGYYGGGGGAASSYDHGGGGGGSGYVGGATNTTNTAGFNASVANSGDTNYPGSVGNGSTAGVKGQNGYIYISY